MSFTQFLNKVLCFVGSTICCQYRTITIFFKKSYNLIVVPYAVTRYHTQFLHKVLYSLGSIVDCQYLNVSSFIGSTLDCQNYNNFSIKVLYFFGSTICSFTHPYLQQDVKTPVEFLNIQDISTLVNSSACNQSMCVV